MTIEPANSRFRLLGFLPFVFFLAQSVHYWQINQVGHLLWMCNVGNILLGLGLLLNKPRWIRIAAIWAVPGLFIWWRYVVSEWFGYATLDWLAVAASTLAHIGGLTIGLLALKRVRIDQITWFYSFIWYLAVQLLSRLVTRAELNVNLSYSIYSGWETVFQSYLRFWLMLAVLVAGGLWLLTWAFHKLWPEPSGNAEVMP
ncbi:MAG TPA: hypothetical protein VN643_11210 [Pyrinomonadaceae bacterium]|nr:hypothetical protein [Pyrinomonadaceae bacterium]